jgi:hypothetical protein
MPIIRATPPEAATQAFADGLKAFLGGPDYGPGRHLVNQKFVGAPPSIPTAADLGIPAGGVDTLPVHDYHPQQVFRLDLKSAASGTLTAALSAGWCYFAGKPPGPVVLARVNPQPSPGNWKMTAVFYGDRAAQALAASLALDLLQTLPAGAFQLRVLAVPGANVEAFWLVPQGIHPDSGKDLFIPFSPSGTREPIPRPSEVTLFSVPQFLAAVQPLAKAVLTAPPNYGW